MFEEIATSSSEQLLDINDINWSLAVIQPNFLQWKPSIVNETVPVITTVHRAWRTWHASLYICPVLHIKIFTQLYVVLLGPHWSWRISCQGIQTNSGCTQGKRHLTRTVWAYFCTSALPSEFFMCILFFSPFQNKNECFPWSNTGRAS